MRTLSPSKRTWAPSQVRIWPMNFTSLRFGTRRITQGSLVSNVAAMIGSTAFFAPLMATSPCNGTEPLINKLSMTNHWIPVFRPRGRVQSRRATMILGR